MRTVLLATGNVKKGKELAEICGADFKVLTLKDVGLDDFNVVEDAPDFVGNAIKKAIAARDALRARSGAVDVDIAVDLVVADDSGLCVDALDGHPGVRTARFANDAGYAPAGFAVDAANNRLLLVMIAAIPACRRGAHFVSAVAGVGFKSDNVVTAEGRVQGRLAVDEHGPGGFGYDPLFIVDDDGAADLRGQRMSELSSTQKNAISHRGRALRLLVPKLAAL